MGSTAPSTSFTILSQMMGASLLSCAFIFHKLGWVLSVLMLVVTLGYAGFQYVYFVQAAHYSQVRTYREMTGVLVNEKLSIVLDIGTVLQKFSALIVYVIVSSQSVIQFSKNILHYDLNPYIVKVVITFVIIYPLCMLKTMKALSRIASISGVAMFMTAVTVLVYFSIHAKSRVLCVPEDGEPIKYGISMWPDMSPLNAALVFLMYIPSFQGNFTAHSVIPTLITELKGPALIRRRILVISLVLSLAMALFFYLAVGLVGADMLGDATTDNVLKALGACGWVWTEVVSLIYAFVVIVAFPLVLYPVRLSLLGMMKQDPESRKGYRVGLLISFVFCILSCVISMVLESIVIIFGFFSSIPGILFYFVVPILFFERYPKIKAEHADVDVMPEGDHEIDPVIVGVASMMQPALSRDVIDRIRTASMRIFKPEKAPEVSGARAQRSLSLVRPRTISVLNKGQVQ